MPQVRMIRLPVLLGLSFAALFGLADEHKAAPPCSGEGASDFDFWLGEWEAYDSNDGSLQGIEHIKKDLAGCVLKQYWEQQSDRYKHPGSDKRMRGISLTARNGNAENALWWQTWVDSVGSYIVLSGHLTDGVMVLDGVPGRSQNQRKWHWQPLDDGSVRSWGTASTDDGLTWQTTWDITYRRPATNH